jgi:hypothetical protein
MVRRRCRRRPGHDDALAMDPGRDAVRAAVALLAVAVLGCAQAQAATKRPPCKPRGTRTQAKGPGIRVFIKDGVGDWGEYRVTYACRYATKRVFKLGVERDYFGGSSGSIDAFEFKDPFVSWQQPIQYDGELDEGGSFDKLGLMNLKTGRAEFVEASDIPDSAITARGSLAWIAVEGEVGGAEISRVRSLVAGVETELDTGPSSAIGALVARRGTLTWTHDGATMSAPLP